MARRKLTSKTAITPSFITPERLRQALFVLVVALMVARPLVLGEDPGLLAPQSDAGGLVLTLLWLVAAVGWAGWRIWSGQGTWCAGTIEGLLLAVAGLMFLSAGLVASYPHPAWLIAWEWLALLVVLSLVRQLAATDAERRTLLAAVLATGVALSGFAVYQAVFELPEVRAQFANDPDALRQELEREGIHIDADDPYLEHFTRRIRDNFVFATFSHPNSFAGYLALLVPPGVGAALVTWRRRCPTWQVALVFVTAFCLLVALGLTRSRGAILGTLLVGAAVAIGYGRAFLWRHRLWAVAGLVIIVGASMLVVRLSGMENALGRAAQSMSLRVEYWTATSRMIEEHPWLGVGPGNFGRHYFLYRSPAGSDEVVSDPHNFALEVWAAGGVFAAAALLVALGVFFRQTAAGFWLPAGPPPAESPPPLLGYLGGMVGLLLAFLLRAWSLPSTDEIVLEAAAAGGRSLVWFAAFAVLLSVPWSAPALVLALTAGVAACLLNLTVSGGIGFPSVAQPLWIFVALVLSLLPAESVTPPAGSHRSLALRLLPFPVLAAVCLAYFLVVFLPVTGCDFRLKQAALAQAVFRMIAQEGNERARGRLNPAVVNKPLAAARQADPSNVAPLVASASWDQELAQSYREPKLGEEALKYLEQARALDPLGKEERLLVFRLHLILAQTFPTQRREHFQAALGAREEVLAVDPAEVARLHYRLAQAYEAVKDTKECRRQAELALQAHEAAPGPAYRLSRLQLANVQRWIKPPQSG